MSDDVMADHLKWLEGKEEAAFQRGLAKGQTQDMELRIKLATRIRELEEALRDLYEAQIAAWPALAKNPILQRAATVLRRHNHHD